MQQKLKMLSGIVLASAFAMTTAQARDFRSADVHPLDYPTVMTVKKMGEVISRRPTAATSRYSATARWVLKKDTVEQVKIGALDMVRVSTAAFHSIARIDGSVVPVHLP